MKPRLRPFLSFPSSGLEQIGERERERERKKEREREKRYSSTPRKERKNKKPRPATVRRYWGILRRRLCDLQRQEERREFVGFGRSKAIEYFCGGVAGLEQCREEKYLRRDHATCLKNALVHMPKLKILDISDNPLEDDGIMSLIPYFAEMSEKHSPFNDLKVENCELSCDGVNQLLFVLSTLTG